MLTKREIKERGWAKKKAAATLVPCACGCGVMICSVDNYGRPKTFVTGHNGRKYDHSDKWAINKAYMKRNRPKVNKWKSSAHRRNKIKAIKWKGGFCERCWLVYDGKNGASFHFHHLDPSIKEATIASMLTNTTFTEVIAELQKCILLCSNCHLVTHHGEY